MSFGNPTKKGVIPEQKIKASRKLVLIGQRLMVTVKIDFMPPIFLFIHREFQVK